MINRFTFPAIVAGAAVIFSLCVDAPGWFVAHNAFWLGIGLSFWLIDWIAE